jgi:hypothetical protein
VTETRNENEAEKTDGTAEDTGPNPPSPPSTDPRIDELRSMNEESEHLDKVIDEAQDAVHAAKEANSMRSSGSEGWTADEEGPQRSG